MGLVPVGFVGGSNLTSFSALDDLRMMIEIFSSIIGFTPSVLDSEKMSRELLTPLMAPPKKSGHSPNWHFPQLALSLTDTSPNWPSHRAKIPQFNNLSL